MYMRDLLGNLVKYTPYNTFLLDKVIDDYVIYLTEYLDSRDY